MSAASSERNSVNNDDFENALSLLTPSSMRGHDVEERTRVEWDDLGGLISAKLALQKAVIWPLERFKTFSLLGTKPPRGVLLYGPPGCGKTSLVLALSHNLNATFLTLTPSDVYSAYVGDSERSIREAFARARACVPALLFLDEMDAIVGTR